MRVSPFPALVVLSIAAVLSERGADGQAPRDADQKVVVATVSKRAAAITQRFACRLRCHRHIEVRTPADGTVTSVPIQEGQAVKQGDLLFRLRRHGDGDTPGAEGADGAILLQAPFDGAVGALPRQEGSFVRKGETLTTLSDNSQMGAYFHVSEAWYLDFMASHPGAHREDVQVELVLATGQTFPQPGKLGAIAAEFDTQTGTIAFRADVPNPDHLLRPGQSGSVVIRQARKDAIVVPQRATFETRNKRYVYVVDENRIAHRREIGVRNEVEDQFVVETGVREGETIVIEGVRRVRDGERLDE